MSYHPASAVLVRARLWRRLARRTVHCAACGGRYRLDRIRFVAQKGRAWLYLARCHKCRSLAVIGVVTLGTKAGRLDADAPGAARTTPVLPITAEEVAAVRKRLEGFDGNVDALFGQASDAG